MHNMARDQAKPYRSHSKIMVVSAQVYNDIKHGIQSQSDTRWSDQ